MFSWIEITSGAHRNELNPILKVNITNKDWKTCPADCMGRITADKAKSHHEGIERFTGKVFRYEGEFFHLYYGGLTTNHYNSNKETFYANYPKTVLRKFLFFVSFFGSNK